MIDKTKSRRFCLYESLFYLGQFVTLTEFEAKCIFEVNDSN